VVARTRYRRAVGSYRFKARLKSAQQGDEAAWTEIYRNLAPAVLGYLRSNGIRDPEDVLSEAFLQVARDLQRFEGDEQQFRAWVFTIVQHRLIDAKRYQARRPVDLVAEPPEPDRPVADETAEAALAQIGAEEIRSAIDTLSPDQRQVLTMRVLGDLTVDEVAKTLGKRPGAIKALQRRGLAAVRRELARRGVTL
jgi:RNA polymerase sigma factor (sigma-70 family)